VRPIGLSRRAYAFRWRIDWLLARDDDRQTMSEWIGILSDDEIKRERAKARELRQSQWWKRRRANGVCHYCGNTFPPAQLTMDHLVPLIRGGRSNKGNLVPACKECNTRKKHQLAFEWTPEAH
jgi:5-methylcytosine-specific restriction endonuclease McrA